MPQDNKLLLLARKGYELLITAGSFSQHLFLLAFRLNWGWQFFQNGSGKFKHHADIVEFSVRLEFPCRI